MSMRNKPIIRQSTLATIKAESRAMQGTIDHRVKDLAPALRHAAEQLLGRSLQDDETVSVFAFKKPGEALSCEQWEAEIDELIDSFPQRPVLSDEAVSRESIYTREDDLS